MRFAYLLLLAAPCAGQSIAVSTGLHAGDASSRYNNPVTMVFERTQTQTLADGTHITSVTHERFYRDSAGRVRFDNELHIPMRNGVPVTTVTVQDPVARFILHWQLGNTGNRQQQFTSTDMDEIRRASAPRRAVNNVGDSSAEPPLPQLHREADATQAQTNEHERPKTTIQKLGMQEVQGAPCEASRMTTVYPVGAMGNDRPLTAITERCLSHEFNRALRESVQDPRNGTRALMLQTITRGEPDPMLFHPPADYEEKSQTP